MKRVREIIQWDDNTQTLYYEDGTQKTEPIEILTFPDGD